MKPEEHLAGGLIVRVNTLQSDAISNMVEFVFQN
jgi:hypothetical protein